jgi:hypothetical protein
MPRRAGKAASRRARQRAAQRGARASARPSAAPTPVPPVGTPDAREAVALDPPRRVSPPAAEAAGDSRLSGHEKDEYHYVERDLRNVAILTAAMFVLLLVAWAAISALGVTA